MKRLLILPTVLLLILTTSCESFKGVFGKSSKAENKQASKIEDVQFAQVKNDRAKMSQVSVLASGTDYALNMVTNKEPPVEVAQDINKRVMSLAGKPNLDAEKEMWKTVDNLTSENAKLRLTGAKQLELRDQKIAELQSDTQMLLDAKDVEIKKYMDLAAKTARDNDTNKAALDEYKGWFGLKAVFLGLKQFFLTSMWVLLGLCILFLILRGFALSNPAIGAIFSIFEQIVSWFINIIAVLFPKALQFAGTVSKDSYEKVSLLLKKIIDNIQNIKEFEKKAGKDISLKEVLIELDKSLNDDQKEFVKKIKKELGY